MHVSHSEVKIRLDLSGLHCPIPVISCKAALLKLKMGECMELIVTDKDALREIPLLVKVSGEQLLGYEYCADGLHLFVMKQSNRTRPACQAQHTPWWYKLKTALPLNTLHG